MLLERRAVSDLIPPLVKVGDACDVTSQKVHVNYTYRISEKK